MDYLSQSFTGETGGQKNGMKRQSLLILAFWSGVVVFLLGQFISFYPGFETTWFAVAGILCLGGLFVPRKAYRIAALVLVPLGITIGVFGKM